MTTLRVFVLRLIGFVTGHRREARLAEEIEAHLRLLTQDHEKRGLAPADARAAAHRDFGGIEQVKEGCRDQRSLPLLDDLRRDIRIASRTLAANPVFAIGAMSTMALGIGATVAMFSVLDHVVLRPLPYPFPERLVRLQSPVPGVRTDAVWNLSTAEYFYFRREASTLEAIGIYVITKGTIGSEAELVGSPAERLVTALVSPEVFDLLGVRPRAGRLFTETDTRYDQLAGRPPGVILSYDVWQRRFNGSEHVIGQTIVYEDQTFPIIGVLGPGIELPETAFVPTAKIGLWMPLGLQPDAPAVNQHTFRAIGRLREGMSLESAQAELTILTRRLPDIFPGAYSPQFMSGSRFSTVVLSLHLDLLGSAGRVVWLLAGAVGLIFIVAAANVANLFVARAEMRGRELAIRLALGASTRHLFIHVLAECVLVCLGAALVGTCLAFACLRLLIVLAPADIPRLAEVRLDGISVTVALIAAIGAALCLAISTTLHSHPNGRTYLTQQTFTLSRPQRRFRNSLAVGQVAMALILTAGSALMVESVRRLLQVEPGFDASGVVMFDVVLPRLRYPSEASAARYFHELAETLTPDAEVEIVSAATITPLDGNDGCSAVFTEEAGNGPCIGMTRVAPDYFRTLRIPVRGQTPSWMQTEGRTAGVVVSESLARRLWPGADAIGRGIRVGSGGPPYYRVVGVAADVRQHGLDRPAVEIAYFPLVSLDGSPLQGGTPRVVRIIVRTSSDQTAQMTSRLRSMMGRLDSTVPIVDGQTLGQLVTRSYASATFATSLLAVSALLTLMLSAVGLQAVLSYAVATRRGEFGLRLALGAAPRSLSAIVIRETIALITIGLAIGLVCSLGLTRLLAGLLFRVSAHDPTLLATASVLLFCVGLTAAAIPAWRASRVDPIASLRND